MSVTVSTFLKMKAEGKKISMITAYDYTTARLVDESGIDSILVGDSLGNVMLGLGRHRIGDDGGHDPPRGRCGPRHEERTRRRRYALHVVSVQRL